jgi:ubiquinone/menaquinone biosynthesis C-methylase UbiE
MQPTTNTLPARIAKQDINAVYKGVAPIYDLWGALTETKARVRCLEWAAIRDGEAVLEVAVGTGLTFSDILQRNPSGRNEGVDLTPAMLERARRRAAATGAQNYQLSQGDAYALDYADNTFDVVVNNFMFDLLPEQDFTTVLAEFKRVLRPGGRVVLVNMTQSACWYHRLWEVVYKINPAWVGGCRGVTLQGPMQALGFTAIRRAFVSQLTFPAEILYGLKAQTEEGDRLA